MRISLGPSASPGAKLAYFPCTDYVLRYLDGERLGRRDLELFIRHRLDRIYPGDVDSVVFDSELSDGAIAVIIAARTDRADFVARYPKADAVALVKGFRTLPGDFRRIALGPGWQEKADRIGGRWSAIERRIRETGSPVHTEWIEGPLPVQVLCDDGEFEATKRSLPDAAVSSYDAALLGRANRLFVGSPSFLSTHALSISAFAAIVLINIGLAALTNTAKEAIDDYKRVLRQAGEVTARAASLDEELAELERGVSASRSGELTPGLVLSALSSAGHGLSLQTFSFSDGRFVVRGSVPDAIMYAERLRSLPAMESARLGDVRTRDDGTEEFSLSGGRQ